jgi:hypothetical protein
MSTSNEVDHGNGGSLVRILGRILATAALAIGMLIAVAPAAQASGPTATTAGMYVGAEAPGRAVPVLRPPMEWVPWDGNHITTAQKCENRRQYLIKTYQLNPAEIRCQMFTCAPNYWMIMRLVYSALAEPVAITTRQDLALCG